MGRTNGLGPSDDGILVGKVEDESTSAPAGDRPPNQIDWTPEAEPFADRPSVPLPVEPMYRINNSGGTGVHYRTLTVDQIVELTKAGYVVREK